MAWIRHHAFGLAVEQLALEQVELLLQRADLGVRNVEFMLKRVGCDDLRHAIAMPEIDLRIIILPMTSAR